jgi:hypothetical protein
MTSINRRNMQELKKTRLITSLIIISIIFIAVLSLATPVSAQDNTTYVGSVFYPQAVKFRLQTLTGLPISNATVIAQLTYGTSSSTTGVNFIDYILNYFGLGSEGSDNLALDETKTGVTGDDGSVVFYMIPSYKYTVNFVHINYGNQSIELYPNDKEYTVYLYPVETPNIAKDVTFDLTMTEINSTAYSLGLNYYDNTSTTLSVWFYVKADRYMGGEDDNEITTITLHSEIFPAVSTVSTSYTILDESGRNATLPYYWGFSAITTAFEKPINQSKLVRFDHKLVGDEIEDIWLEWGCICLLVALVALGSRFNSKEIFLSMAVLAAFFKFLRWFYISGNDYIDWSVIALILTFAILYYIRYREKEEHL